MSQQSDLKTASPTVPGAKARVKSIAVNGLFGAFNHVVELRDDTRATIVLGPNGVGKTHLLECVAGLFNGRLERLVSVPFSTLRVELDDGTALCVQQFAHQIPQPHGELAHASMRFKNRMRRTQMRRMLILQLFRGEAAASETWEVSDRPKDQRTSEHGREELPAWVEPLEFGSWYDRQTDRVMTTRELSILYGLREAAFGRGADVPDWFRAILDRTSVRLIETQRLLRTQRRSRPSPVRDDRAALRFAVRELTEDLGERLIDVRRRYLRAATTLDESYVDRFLRYQPPEEEAAPEALQTRLTEIAARRARLERLALLDAERGAGTADRMTGVSDDKRLALSLFARDMASKLDVLEPLADQLERLLGIVNPKLRNKQIVLDAADGLLVETTFGKIERIDLEYLSSGEQHELVLLYDLMFRVHPGSLVLIDEPELSLHPMWQQQFVDDLINIADSGKFDVVLATHSPYIVGKRSCITLSDVPSV